MADVSKKKRTGPYTRLIETVKAIHDVWTGARVRPSTRSLPIAYDPEGDLLKDLYRPAHEIASRFMLPLKYTKADIAAYAEAKVVPPRGAVAGAWREASGRLRLMRPVRDGGRWQFRPTTVRFESARELAELARLPEYKASRMLEAVGDPFAYYRRVAPEFFRGRPFREQGDPFAYGDLGDQPLQTGLSSTGNIDQEYVPILCFTGDTKVRLLNGTEATMEELANRGPGASFWVYAVSADGRVVPGLAHGARRTGRQAKVVEVMLDNGETVRCTPGHRFMLRDGTYCEARRLVAGTSMMPLYTKPSEKGLPGYELLYQPRLNRWVYTHKSFTGRVRQGYVVHHWDFNRRNNCSENLVVVTRAKHRSIHNTARRWTPEMRAKVTVSVREALKDPALRAVAVQALARGRVNRWARPGERHAWSELMQERWTDSAFRAKAVAGHQQALTPERRSKLSVCSRKRWAKPGERERGSVISKRTAAARWARPGESQRLSATLRATWEKMSPERYAAFCEMRQQRAGRGWSHSSKARKKIGQTSAARWADPAYRERVSSAIRESRQLNHTVVSVKPAGRADVYDFSVDQHENFALSAGVFVHNSGPYHKQLYLADYLLMHARAFELKNHHPLAKAIIDITTRFALGRSVTVEIGDDAVRLLWEEFATRNELDEKVRVWSDDLTWQGELMIRHRTLLPGMLKVWEQDSSTCWEIVTNPEDISQVFYYHCLHGDTEIPLADGMTQPVRDLVGRSDFYVYSYDEKAQRVAPGKVRRVWRTGRKRCVKVVLDNGKSVVCSCDHPFMLRDGTYLRADALPVGQSLMPLYRRQGYESVWHPGRGKWQLTHEAFCLEPKQPGLVIDHTNGNERNNSPGNLHRMTRGQHTQKTQLGSWEGHPRLEILRREMSERATRKWEDPRYRRKMSRMLRRLRNDPQHDDARKAGHRAACDDPEKRALWSARISASLKAYVERRHAAGLKAYADHPYVNHKVVSVEPAGVHSVYDLTVEPHHNLALDAGVFVHNCQWPSPWQLFTVPGLPVSKYVIEQVPPGEIRHYKVNVSSGEKRGRCDYYSSMTWMKRFRDYYTAVAIKKMLEAQFVWKVKVHGDAGDVSAVMNDAVSQTLPSAGGTWYENDAVELSGMPANFTGSTGTGESGQELANIIATSVNLPSDYFNVTSRGGARAAALTKTEPAVKKFQERQDKLQGVLQDLFEDMMRCAVEGGRLDARQAARADAEFILPTIYEEDRSAKFKDVQLAYEVKAISHRRLSTTMASELGAEEYNYDEEMEEITAEADVPVLQAFPQVPAAGAGPGAGGGTTLDFGGKGTFGGAPQAEDGDGDGTPGPPTDATPGLLDRVPARTEPTAVTRDRERGLKSRFLVTGRKVASPEDRRSIKLRGAESSKKGGRDDE